jgi:hypothetical protein
MIPVGLSDDRVKLTNGYTLNLLRTLDAGNAAEFTLDGPQRLDNLVLPLNRTCRLDLLPSDKGGKFNLYLKWMGRISVEAVTDSQALEGLISAEVSTRKIEKKKQGYLWISIFIGLLLVGFFILVLIVRSVSCIECCL